MTIPTDQLPTQIALVARRLNLVPKDQWAERFLLTSYLAEVSVKSIVVALYAGLQTGSSGDAYRLGHKLVHADGLGDWDTAIRSCTNLPLTKLFPAGFSPLLAWLNKRRGKAEDIWFRDAHASMMKVLDELDSRDESSEKAANVIGLITGLVRIRNKTKAHGAVGSDFFGVANNYYLDVVLAILGHCPVFSWPWYHIRAGEDKATVVALRGNNPLHDSSISPSTFLSKASGVYVQPDSASLAYPCFDLLRSNYECTEFFFPNGGYLPRGQSEFINYANARNERQDVLQFSEPPPALPPSETEGLSALDVQSNVFGNLPPVPKGFVERKGLQKQLEDRLLDRNHAIITLHGRGGVGKTSLALFVAHKLAAETAPRFDQIIWFSARDVDLRASGAYRVQPAVLDLAAISQAYGTLLSTQVSTSEFAAILQGTGLNSADKGTLFIFDNFETLSDVRGIHEFLDNHTLLPNKVLITSRERAFKADYPIEVRGMEYSEAAIMLRGLGSELQIEGIVTPEVVQKIYDYSEGHAYVMRVLVGEIARERRYVPITQVMNKRLDIVDAVFERSFNKLTDAGRYVFLAIANWKSSVAELALLVVLGQRAIDVEEGLEECTRLSLIVEVALQDGQPCYYAPQLARLFGQKKLEGDSDRLVIQEDIETIRKFGVIDPHQLRRQTQDEQIQKFVAWCINSDIKEQALIERLDKILESVADLWPPAWLDLAKYRRKYEFDRKNIEYAFRRAVEEMPFRKTVWLERARYAKIVGDEATQITSLVSAVDADPADLDLLGEVAYQLSRYINNHKADIPKTRRGVYLASVRAHMERVAVHLDATNLSRLAWLFLLENDKQNGWKYAKLGLTRDPYNEHCNSIVQRLRSDGYTPPE